MLPTAAEREKEFFGDTPNPGRGLRPLHSCFVRCLRRRKGKRSFSGHPEPRQRTASSALLLLYSVQLDCCQSFNEGVNDKLVLFIITRQERESIPTLLYSSNVFLYFFGGITGHAIEGCEVIDASRANSTNRAVVLHQGLLALRPDAWNLV